MPLDQWDDLDSENTVNAIVEAIRVSGHEGEFLEGDITLFDTIRKYKPDLCFNICEGHFGDAREAQVPAILEMLRIPYTGSKVLTLALTLDKPMTKRVLTYEDIVQELNWYTAAVFRVTGALDVARVDFRLDQNDNWKPYILEINPLPGLSPGVSDLVIEAAALGISHTELVNLILTTALQRCGMLA